MTSAKAKVNEHAMSSTKDRCIRRRRNGQRQPASHTQRAHQHEIPLAPRAAQGQEVGQEAVDRLDGPTQANHGPHKAGLTGTQVQVFFEQILNRLIGQTGGEIDCALNKIERGEEQRRTPNPFTPEGLKCLPE